MSSSYAVLFFALIALSAAKKPSISVDVDAKSGQYSLFLNGKSWLESSQSPQRLFAGGAWHDMTLKETSQDGPGRDELGSFHSSTTLIWGDGPVAAKTAFRMYDEGHVAFEQSLPDGASGTNTTWCVVGSGCTGFKDPNFISAPPFFPFPSFATEAALGSSQDLGWLTWQGTMVNAYKGVGGIPPMRSNATRDEDGIEVEMVGLSGGPVVLYGGRKFQNAAVMISPATNFKGSLGHRSNSTWSHGMSSDILEVPKGYRHVTVVVAGDGVTETMDAYGGILRRAYGTAHPFEQDPTVKHPPRRTTVSPCSI